MRRETWSWKIPSPELWCCSNLVNQKAHETLMKSDAFLLTRFALKTPLFDSCLYIRLYSYIFYLSLRLKSYTELCCFTGIKAAEHQLVTPDSSYDCVFLEVSSPCSQHGTNGGGKVKPLDSEYFIAGCDCEPAWPSGCVACLVWHHASHYIWCFAAMNFYIPDFYVSSITTSALGLSTVSLSYYERGNAAL